MKDDKSEASIKKRSSQPQLQSQVDEAKDDDDDLNKSIESDHVQACNSVECTTKKPHVHTIVSNHFITSSLIILENNN